MLNELNCETSTYLEVSELNLGLAEVDTASATSGKVILFIPGLNMAKPASFNTAC